MNKKIIWVIDDDAIYQIIISKLIQKAGYFSSYSSFPNGKEAMNALKKLTDNNDTNLLPDIILLDINMPIMDGWEFMEEIKELKSNIAERIHIYIVSSSISIEDKNKAKTFTDIKGYIPKPITVNELITIVLEE